MLDYIATYLLNNFKICGLYTKKIQGDVNYVIN